MDTSPKNRMSWIIYVATECASSRCTYKRPPEPTTLDLVPCGWIQPNATTVTRIGWLKQMDTGDVPNAIDFGTGEYGRHRAAEPITRQFVDDRPSFDEYFLAIAEVVSLRGDCTRSQVGCVLVRSDHTVAGIGYNGTYAGRPGCLLGACPRGRRTYSQQEPYGNYSDCIATHAEHNAILNSNPGDHGVTAYITRAPCDDCATLLGHQGITRIVWPNGSRNVHPN